MLDPLHIILMAAVGLVSLLFTVVAFFINRDFKSRDKRDEQLLETLRAIQGDLTRHEGRISSVEAQVADNMTRIKEVAANAHKALDIANVLHGRMAGTG